MIKLKCIEPDDARIPASNIDFIWHIPVIIIVYWYLQKFY